jgi:hypothetical protein
MDLTTILISITSLVGAVFTAIITGYYSVKVKKLEKENGVISDKLSRANAELECIDIVFGADTIAVINEVVDTIFEKTKAERFLVLFAVNGKVDFNFVSVCYERTKSNVGRGAIYRYVRVKIDEHYKKMLKIAEMDGSVYIDVDAMEDCLLKDIYTSSAEGIKFSVVNFVGRKSIDSSNDMLFYNSVSTSSKSSFTHDEFFDIKISMDKLRAHSSSIDFSRR